ncbi:Zinc finger CCCH domain-containing protein 6 [Leucoagaricus sp. SymC.cos]|nr:Zinc finger CCCH domain-containing protein 6 [Leucoagaricus sp. SymC.cos]
MATLGLPNCPALEHSLPTEFKTDPDSFKFPHTRAQLSAVARQHKQGEYPGEPDAEDLSRVPSTLVNKVVSLLVDENEDELKALLKEQFDLDDETVEENVLDLMHKHRDDVAGVPFLFLTPTRRPISRPSSRASSHSARLHPARPDTPSSAPPSPLAWPHRRPHTPATSPLANGEPRSYMSAKSDYSPSSSPILAHAQATQAQAQWTASLPASPLLTSRSLNAKASEFRPIPRPLSSASSQPGSLLRADTPSPDMWAHSSPRATSNLAIAAPLIADQSTSAPKPITPSSSLRSFVRPDDEDEEDPYDPFANPSALPPPFHSITVSDFDSQWSVSPPKESDLAVHMGTSAQPHYDAYGYHQYNVNDNNDPIDEAEANAALTDGMTPFDVLSSVFGSTLAPSELEEALAVNGYDFERAMAWLIDRVLPSQQGQQPQSTSPTQARTQSMGGRATLISRDAGVNMRGNSRGGYHNNNNNGAGRGAPRYVNGRPAQGGNRVCRYFVAGECLRADCRFSHDLERALCRFWLRGMCAKNETCEFMHRLPEGADIASLNIAMSRASIRGPHGGHMGPPHEMHNPAVDEFPVLGYEGNVGMVKQGPYYDPSRTRFANAVKKPLPPKINGVHFSRVMGPAAENLHQPSAIVAPRPSPRLKLRPPTLLPTLPTGEAVNQLYMTYRQRALQLGAARNACLSRAADAWRRGDGAAAKRFSREGHDLNDKMAFEMGNAASKLVCERARLAEQAVRARDLGWSDDPGDRTARGKPCGSGFGVILGVARREIGDGTLTADERTECMLDLHGLHSNEATEVLEQFLLALESEHFYGLAYAIVGEEKHTGTQDPARGASRNRLATGVREWVHRWGYPWSERDGIICIDPLTHASE